MAWGPPRAWFFRMLLAVLFISLSVTLPTPSAPPAWCISQRLPPPVTIPFNLPSIFDDPDPPVGLECKHYFCGAPAMRLPNDWTCYAVRALEDFWREARRGVVSGRRIRAETSGWRRAGGCGAVGASAGWGGGARGVSSRLGFSGLGWGGVKEV